MWVGAVCDVGLAQREGGQLICTHALVMDAQLICTHALVMDAGLVVRYLPLVGMYPYTCSSDGCWSCCEGSDLGWDGSVCMLLVGMDLGHKFQAAGTCVFFGTVPGTHYGYMFPRRARVIRALRLHLLHYDL
jgi:hypothetical protein